MNADPTRQTALSAAVPAGRRVRVRVKGIVQGVGFRPFVFQLASAHGIGGWVRNQPDGVEIEASGPESRIEEFVADISAKAPPLARIVSVETIELPFAALGAFSIAKSRAGQVRSTLISPDTCTCEDCLRELFDPADRRYRYPFINCTNCGPRYTIIKDVPYDREKTTMAGFSMCPACRAEYEDPMNRRFHAQPNACRECGPDVWLEGAEGKRISGRDAAVLDAVRLLAGGAIVAVKGLGGFHLAVAASDQEAVARLRGRKIREDKPFAVMFPDAGAVASCRRVSEAERELLESGARPIVLLPRGEDAKGQIAAAVAPKNRYLGVFLPYTPLHHLLLNNAPYRALVMTSGNQSDEPIVMDNADARARLSGVADYFLFHDRDIYMRCDDSVTRVLGGRRRPVRRARGYTPAPVFLESAGPSVLGVGAELKNTVCLTRGNEAFLSQHIGDLENLETLRSFEHSISHLERILEIEPECVAHDLHPDYLSTRWALGREGLPQLGVQHHHAHIAAVMAERKLEGPVIGLALDGAGVGPDGTVWGGELLVVEGAGFTRLGHLRRAPLPGGDMAVKEPWRMAVSYLCGMARDGDAVESEFGDILRRWPQQRLRVLFRMIGRGINSPLTSSCGRLFDAVSSLAGVRDAVNYEGQAAIEFEQAITPDSGAYEGELVKEGGLWIVDPFPMVRSVVEDLRKGCATGEIAARFHNGLVHLLAGAVGRVAKETGLNRVALSGGVFQNATLSDGLEAELAGMGLKVFGHIEVPPNDACISLGQAHVAAKWMREGNTAR